MQLRHVLTAIGAGVTTFFLSAVLVIELLDFEFSPIIALPVGMIAGLAVVVGLWVRLSELSPGARRVASAYATFGLTILLLLGLSYVNIGRDLFSAEVIAGTGIGFAVVVYTVLWLVERREN